MYGSFGLIIFITENLPCCASQEIDFYTLWAEEILTEDNLILDILFLIYYEFCTCSGKQWRKLCLLYEVIHYFPRCCSNQFVYSAILTAFFIAGFHF